MSALARDIERACKQGVMADALKYFARMQDEAPGAIGALTALRDTMVQGVGIEH